MTGLHNLMHRLLPILMIILSLFLISTARAGYYYQYTDEKGNTHFTDDPGNVPEGKQSEMIERRGMPSEKSNSGNNAVQRRSSASQMPAPAGETWDQREKRRGASLDQERKKLQKQYEDISKSQQELGEPPPSTASQSEKRRYEEQVEALNRRIESYERQRKQFDEKVSEFRTGR